ncbi:B3/B4 domain-containing protein [Microbacterium gilvum]|uniref:B3/4 domain-containing protein n=1 Tax=Microbacterium gilvum TaxID=1336204 RepID=A0ABP8ZUL5_9MICO
MDELNEQEAFLARCAIDVEVHALRPDYRALLLVVDGLEPSTTSEAVDDLVTAAERRARELVAERPLEEHPHIAAWRDAYRAFGAKPQRTRNSVEALTRRAVDALPRVNALTDAYNAISVLQQVPIGGEDRTAYRGAARLVRAAGDEPFDTVAGGEPVIEHPERGEVVWRDDDGITCRRWNWRQGRRTALRDDTTDALFILDALGPMSDADLQFAGDALADALRQLGRQVRIARRVVRGS